MAKLVQMQKIKQEREGNRPFPTFTVSPTSIHAHLFDLAVLKELSGEKVTSSEAVDLIDRKFHQSSQRRELKRNEVENAVSNAFGSSGVKSKSSSTCSSPADQDFSRECLAEEPERVGS